MCYNLRAVNDWRKLFDAIMEAAAGQAPIVGLTAVAVRYRAQWTDIEIYVSDGVFEATSYVDLLNPRPARGADYFTAALRPILDHRATHATASG
jgi:hypothetical protein